MIRDLILKNRSYRRFHENEAVGMETLRDLVDLARLSASSANLQPLKYILSCTRERNDLVFTCLKWAGYLKWWGGPKEGERPPAYIIVLGDTSISRNFGCDQGIAAQSMLLGAVDMGLGGCVLSNIDRNTLRSSLNIPERYEILIVIAIGRPAEKVIIETVGEDGDVKYWRDEKDVHHVPKRKLEEIIIEP